MSILLALSHPPTHVYVLEKKHLQGSCAACSVQDVLRPTEATEHTNISYQAQVRMDDIVGACRNEH